MQGRGSTKNTEALTRKHERSEIKHTQKGRCLKTHGKAVEGLIFKQGDTQGCSWSECLGEVRKHLSTPGASLTLSPCLSVCELSLSNLKTVHQLKSPGNAWLCPESHLTKLVPPPKGLGFGVWERRAKKSPTLSYLSAQPHRFQRNKPALEKSQDCFSIC